MKTNPNQSSTSGINRHRSTSPFRIVVLATFLCTFQFVFTASKPYPGHNGATVNSDLYESYPKELISYIRKQSQIYNSAERKSETYVEIDQLAYYDNIQLIRKRILKDSCMLMAVLKGDAYGCGIEHLGKIAEFAGADYLGFTENSEIIKLRDLDIKLPVFRMRLASDKELTDVHTNPVIFGEVEEMVGSLHMASRLSKIALKQKRIINIHLSLNSGRMSRDGFDMGYPGIRDSIIELFKLRNICIRGIMTHFANADTANTGTLKGLLSEFLTDAQWIIKKGSLKRDNIILHAAATNLALRLPESHLDLVRLGTVTYGIESLKESPAELKPIQSLYTSIGQILFYPKGSVVGYGSTYRLEKDSYLANLPIGWNNGIPRNIKYALVNGQRVSVAGAMSMNATMIDITPIHDQVRSGDQVVFYGKQGNEEITVESVWKSTEVAPWTMYHNVGRLDTDARYPKKLVSE